MVWNIYAPVNREEHLTKELSQNEASRRLSYLADIVDTEGWAIKHSIAPVNTTVREEYSNEARAAEDMFDNSRVSSNVDNLLNQHDQRRKQQIIQNLDMARNLAQFTDENSENIQDKTYYFDPKNRYEGSDNIKFEDVQVSEPAEAKPTAFSQNQQNQYQMNFNRNQPQMQNGAFSNWQNWNQSQAENYNNFQQNKNWQNQPQQNFDENIHLNYNPYPDSMNQTVISPNWQNQPQQFTQPSPQPLSNFTPPSPQPAQQSEPQNHFENPPDDFNQDLEGINNSFERIRQVSETIEREKRDPKVRISTNPENNPFINRRNFTERESANKISAEMKRLVSEGKDLSVETLARQANKLADKEKKAQENSNEVDLGEKEVVISLR